MKVVYTTGYQGELSDDLTEMLYSTEYMSLQALILLHRRMEALDILSFEDDNGNFVAIGSVKDKIQKKIGNR